MGNHSALGLDQLVVDLDLTSALGRRRRRHRLLALRLLGQDEVQDHSQHRSQQRQQRPFGLRYAKFIIIFFECFSQMASCRAEEVPRLPCAQNSIPLYF